MSHKRKAAGLALLGEYGSGSDDSNVSQDGSAERDDAGGAALDGGPQSSGRPAVGDSLAGEDKGIAKRPRADEGRLRAENDGGVSRGEDSGPERAPPGLVSAAGAAPSLRTARVPLPPEGDSDATPVAGFSAPPVDPDVDEPYAARGPTLGCAGPGPTASSPVELPPQPAGGCAPELQVKVSVYLGKMTKGLSINSRLRASKDYCNPDFLAKIVGHFDIDPLGTCYPPSLFDPRALAESDTAEILAAELRAMQDAREAERRAATAGGIHFVAPGGGAPAALAPGALGAAVKAAAVKAAAAAAAAAASAASRQQAGTSGATAAATAAAAARRAARWSDAPVAGQR